MSRFLTKLPQNFINSRHFHVSLNDLRPLTGPPKLSPYDVCVKFNFETFEIDFQWNFSFLCVSCRWTQSFVLMSIHKISLKDLLNAMTPTTWHLIHPSRTLGVKLHASTHRDICLAYLTVMLVRPVPRSFQSVWWGTLRPPCCPRTSWNTTCKMEPKAIRF